MPDDGRSISRNKAHLNIQKNHCFEIHLKIFEMNVLKYINLILLIFYQHLDYHGKLVLKKNRNRIRIINWYWYVIKGILMQIWTSTDIFVSTWKTICRRFHIITAFTFWALHSWDIWNVCLQTYKNNKIC